MNTIMELMLLAFFGYIYPSAAIAGAFILRKEKAPRRCFGTIDALTYLMSPMVMVVLALLVGNIKEGGVPTEYLLSAILWTVTFVAVVFAGVEVYEY